MESASGRQKAGMSLASGGGEEEMVQCKEGCLGWVKGLDFIPNAGPRKV